jgi:prophage regulatory protein
MLHQISKLPRVKKDTTLSGSTIYRLVSEGKFPKPIKLSKRSSGWITSEVQDWIQQRINASRPDQLEG